MTRNLMYGDVEYAARGSAIVRDPSVEARKRTPPVAVYEMPPYPGPWSGNNQLGNIVAYSSNAQNRQLVLRLSELGWPRAWTVSLGSLYTAGGTYGWGITAHVVAGSGGATQEFDCDWSEGTSFGLTFNAIDVIAVYSGAPTAVPSDLRLSARIGMGTANNRPVYTTGPYTVSAVGYSSVIPIPAFARKMKVLYRGGLPVNPTLYALGNGVFFPRNSALSINSFHDLELIGNTAGFPIPNGSKVCLIYNATSTPFDVLTQFELAVG